MMLKLRYEIWRSKYISPIQNIFLQQQNEYNREALILMLTSAKYAMKKIYQL